MGWTSNPKEWLMSEAVPASVEEIPLTPNTILTFTCCKCHALFDIRTNSYRALSNAARQAGWTIKYLDVGYNCYCGYCKE